MSREYRNLPASLAQGVGETQAAWDARIATYVAANPGVVRELPTQAALAQAAAFRGSAAIRNMALPHHIGLRIASLPA